ncbi:hypothetical protein SERLA73DRAFT_48172 [Serpula lacrymans var. lacrymans S7.3]|uniref:AMP-dependent synthetase/ligase domain-containing protein n=1 Tax=Serpula lacrymans var. lacrymans (strain S7.3) TaxID=936435 RepID=F8PMR5_SERL3|nr:hypothetical protein SERLA73DRAFT_48172 [Serpula lacrymans var. lacrymans S7.3]
MSSEDLIALFRQRVATEPTAIAVQDRYFTLTYSELERWSNNLGHEIFFRLKNTAGSGTVAICIPRSVLFVVSVLAVIKAGFSYIPLDPSAPPARLDDQVLQSDARLLLTRSGHQLTSLGRAIPFDIVPFMERTCIFGHTELPSSCLNSRNDTLVILFTSGSTGRPKGVLIQHLSMVNMVKARLLEIQPGDCVAMVNNITFDASSLEIWSALCHGGTLFVLTAHLADTEAVVAFFVDNSITKTFLPTAVFHHVISDVSNAASLSKTLRMLVVGGEKLQTAAVKKFFSHAPTTRLVNLYGPTETTIYITTFEIPMDNFDYDDSLSRPIPIGRCLPNTTVYLLDDKLRPVEPGHPGEICIGGAGLSAGYLGQADITSSSKFEEDGSSTRVYRTGDIGRFIPSVDGPLLEFIGRNDNQVKIRGQRLEPGEIEAVLCAGSDGIDQAAVVVTADDQIIAYSVVETHHARDLTVKLHDRCREKLPSYMVPHRIIVKASLPLTGNGKVDRRMLAESSMWAESLLLGAQSELCHPENDIQAQVQECIAKVLHEEPLKVVIHKILRLSSLNPHYCFSNYHRSLFKPTLSL